MRGSIRTTPSFTTTELSPAELAEGKRQIDSALARLGRFDDAALRTKLHGMLARVVVEGLEQLCIAWGERRSMPRALIEVPFGAAPIAEAVELWVGPDAPEAVWNREREQRQVVAEDLEKQRQERATTSAHDEVARMRASVAQESAQAWARRTRTSRALRTVAAETKDPKFAEFALSLANAFDAEPEVVTLSGVDARGNLHDPIRMERFARLNNQGARK